MSLESYFPGPGLSLAVNHALRAAISRKRNPCSELSKKSQNLLSIQEHIVPSALCIHRAAKGCPTTKTHTQQHRDRRAPN